MYKIIIQIIFILSLFLYNSSASGQSDSLRFNLIESLSNTLQRKYLSKDLGKQMSDSIKNKYETGGYDRSLNSDEFAFEITRDLRRISGDNHISITPPHYDYIQDSINAVEIFEKLIGKKRKYQKKIGTLNTFDKVYRERTKEDMFEYGDIKILPGNIGYVEILDFESTSYFKAKNKNRIPLSSVFQFLGNTNSIILDLRENQGGLVRMQARFCSYFSKIPSSYLSTTESFIRYDSNCIEKEASFKSVYKTDSNITNSLTEHKKIFILISNRTFSAAESATYNIKKLVPQTTIIGEKTTGGGNIISDPIYNRDYTAAIPSGRSFDESNANYNLEGKGINPDIYCVSDSAFDIALHMANNVTSNKQNQKTKYFHKKSIFVDKPEYVKYYPEYIGDYRKIVVYSSNGKLYMIYDVYKKALLITKTKDLFQSDIYELIRFVRNNNDSICEIQIKHKNGYLEKFRKR